MKPVLENRGRRDKSVETMARLLIKIITIEKNRGGENFATTYVKIISWKEDPIFRETRNACIASANAMNAIGRVEQSLEGRWQIEARHRATPVSPAKPPPH